ncbi:MAG: hypothetical protein KKG60_03410 [Nanoarchaeota archaeon]|nr:hypothetical protein [Nanoarchaeota archaeon]
MVLSPEEAVKLTKREEKELSGIEEKVDDWLSKNYLLDGREEVECDLYLLGRRVRNSLPQKLMDYLVTRYREKGWNVRQDNDQDVLYFKFNKIEENTTKYLQKKEKE